MATNMTNYTVLTAQNRDFTVQQPQLRGYSKLAALMGSYPEAAIFRRFGTLNMLNLLRLQAELTDLEFQLQDIRSEDETDPRSLQYSFAVDFRAMKESEGTGDDLQWKKLSEIGKKLNQYSHPESWSQC